MLATVGCASITHETSHPMRVETFTQEGQAVLGAECTLTNDYPATTGKSGRGVSVHRSSKDLDIACISQEHGLATGRAISRANAGMAGNLLFGGGIGVIIDHNKGTAYTYPTWVRLVFGQARTFDRRDEKDGHVVLGTSSDAAPLLADSQVPPVATPAAPPALRAAPLAVPQPAQRAAYIATGYAKIDDVDAIPFLNDNGRQSYRNWLTKGTPRAFAISPTGTLAASFGLKPGDETLPSDPVERAVVACNRISKTACRLYAVNGSVVWVKDAAPAAP
ncbi:hypothetical protein SAMN05216303_102747 [Rhodoferax sp. OV413]|nr:hypothetical protein SAMN05216303_102747 [Rhodoferax sp. OV413]